MYNKLLGPYPYTKFALVENFWETGYGMPSFTPVSYTHLRAHETVLDLVCRLLLEKKNKTNTTDHIHLRTYIYA